MEIRANFFPELARPASSTMPMPMHLASSNTMAWRRRECGGRGAVPIVDSSVTVFESQKPSETPVTLWLSAAGLGRVAQVAAGNEAFCDMESFEEMAPYASSAAAEARLKQFVATMRLDQREELRLRSALETLAPVLDVK